MTKKVNHLIPILLLFQISQCFETCSKYIDVRTADESKEFETICIQCSLVFRPRYNERQYSLNDRYECYYFQQDNCKRVNERFTCQEHLNQCFVLKESNYSVAQILNDKCSIVTEDLTACTMPKFGYTLILPQRQFEVMNQTYCAISNSNTGKCIKYHHRFLPVKDAGYSVFFKDFFNFDKINHEQSHSTSIVCDKDYKHHQQVNGAQGCLSLLSSDDNCIQFNEWQTCLLCKDGYAINAISGICELSFLENCVIQNFVENKFVCQKCKQGFFIENKQCIQIQNCALFSQYPPYYCLACYFPHGQQNCSQSGGFTESCEIQSVEDSCLKCKNNEFFYANAIKRKCEIRQNSMNCKVKHPLGDYCGQLNQADMIYYYGLQSQDFTLKINQSIEDYLKQIKILPFFNVFEENIEYFQNTGINYQIENPILMKTSLVDDCVEYSYIEDQCIKCNKDKYLWLFDGVSSCRSETLPSPTNSQVGCLLIDQKSQNCINCKERYYLNTSLSICEPITDPHCIYGIDSSCIQCEKGYQQHFYTTTNECIKVPNCRNWYAYLYSGCDQCLQGPSFMITKIFKDNRLICANNTGNCEQMKDGQCKQCFDGYTNNLTDNQCIQLDQLNFCKYSSNQNTCIECKEDYNLINNKCIPKSISICQNVNPPSCNLNNYPYCSECYNEKCKKCVAEYALVQNKCFPQCKDGKIVQDKKECNDSQINNCNSDCSECSKTNQCLKCKNYTYLFNGSCIKACPSGYSINSSSECVKCSSNCQSCYKYEWCDVCGSTYKQIEGKCLPSCNDGRIVQDLSQCSEVLCKQSCKKCKSADYCLECVNEKDVLYNGQCLSCPLGTFLDKDYKCHACPKQCLSCFSFDKCSVCASSGTSPEQNCLCKNDELLYNNKCVIYCPFGWNANIVQVNCYVKSCERICANETYPVYKVDRKEYQCQSVINDSSDYCLQFIEQIPSSVQIKLKKVDSIDENINLFAVFNETPQQCYTYQLFGKSSFEIPLQKINATLHQTQFDIKISKLDLINPDKVEINEKYSFLYLKIFYKNFLQYTLRIRITFALDLILSNEFQYNGEHQVIDPLCEDCEVPQEKQIQSETSVKCPANAQCKDGKISVYTNDEIQITQQITDPKYSKNIIKPHSLKIKFTDSDGKELIFQIKNYIFSNSEIGKITYYFKAIGGKNGQLIVISKVFSASQVSRILQSSTNSQQDVVNSNYWYGTQVFNIEYKDLDEDEDSNELGQLEIILICVCTIAVSIVIIGGIYLVYKKKKQIRSNKIYIENQQQNKNFKAEKEIIEDSAGIIKIDQSYQ